MRKKQKCDGPADFIFFFISIARRMLCAQRNCGKGENLGTVSSFESLKEDMDYHKFWRQIAMDLYPPGSDGPLELRFYEANMQSLASAATWTGGNARNQLDNYKVDVTEASLAEIMAYRPCVQPGDHWLVMRETRNKAGRWHGVPLRNFTEDHVRIYFPLGRRGASAAYTYMVFENQAAAAAWTGSDKLDAHEYT
jgi:hypothetical protein